MFCVVGSGPAGVSCAQALLQAGARVTMLDAGFELEPERQARLASLQRVPPDRWTNESTGFIRDGVTVESSGIPLKLAYGSDFPYREPVGLAMTRHGADGKPSYAKGGLSNVWGASVMPFRTEDMTGWPITADDLAPHYRDVLSWMPFAARHDALEDAFPLYRDDPGELRPSSQAAALLRDLEAARPTLLDHGVRFGASRLAVRAQSNGRPGCVYCAQCMYGCPYGFIYSASETLDELRSHRGFAYTPGLIVDRVIEDDRRVELSGRKLDSGEPFRIGADGVFLACGVFSTARVLLASMDAYDRRVQALDNCYFLLPLLRYRGQKHAARESLHTLAQVFVDVVDPAVGPHTAHLQVYTYNDLYRAQVKNILGPIDRLLGGAVERTLLTRMLIIQGYLHSDLSAGITLSLDRDGRLALAAEPNPRTRSALSALMRRLWAERGSLRAVPIRPALRVSRPGRGFHTGGTFPMRSTPRPFETDTLGRPYGMSRVHVVDASVFPTLPATTITLSVMANAHRIGAAAAA